MLMPTLDNKLMINIVNYIQGDLRKIKSTHYLDRKDDGLKKIIL